MIELDRFSHADIGRWRAASKDLDQLNNSLYFNLEPQRQRYREDFLAALRSVAPIRFDFFAWQRIVTYQYSLAPLSAAGSLTQFGGRFNVGVGVDKSIDAPWPALYLASDVATAFRERFQLDAADHINGLTPQELALVGAGSFTKVEVHGHLEQVFDLDAPHCLDAFCQVLRKIQMPPDVRPLRRRLGISPKRPALIRTTAQLREHALIKNWRALPAQFGLPAPSQLLAGMIRDAGFEAIKYPSTKAHGQCLAVFPDKLVSDQSFVALSDAVPPGVEYVRLDLATAESLSGWDIIRATR